MTTPHQAEPAEESLCGSPLDRKAYIVALERALRETTLALAKTGRRQNGLLERLAAVRRVLDLSGCPADAVMEIRRILDEPQ